MSCFGEVLPSGRPGPQAARLPRTPWLFAERYVLKSWPLHRVCPVLLKEAFGQGSQRGTEVLSSPDNGGGKSDAHNCKNNVATETKATKTEGDQGGFLEEGA